MKVLVVVDMQKDFVDGVLGTKEAEIIVPAVVERVREAYADPNTIVLFTRDTHKQNYMETQEGKNLPYPHCVERTEGWEIIPELREYSRKAVGIIADKPSFGSLTLPALVKEATHNNLEEIELCGLCTEICVNSNAAILKAAFPEVPIKVDANLCAGVTPQNHAIGLLSMKSWQIDVKNMPEIEIKLAEHNRPLTKVQEKIQGGI